jgi:hypothetical protein
MAQLVNRPILWALMTFLVLLAAAWAGVAFRAWKGEVSEEERADFGLILTSTLTLLGLIIGFTFSMAISRYDQRKNYEEEEANAIGTEYVRADLMPEPNATKVRELLKTYLALRISFYETRGRENIEKVNERTLQLQSELWKQVTVPALADKTAVTGLTVSGMNDVLNSQGYTQAAWWNRIPPAAWELMWAIATCCNLMFGFYMRPEKHHWLRMVVVPLITAVSFLLIADIDSPRWGIIRVRAQNLVSLQQQLK